MHTAPITIDRRRFLAAGAAASAGLSLGLTLLPGGSRAAAGTGTPVNTWLTVGTDNSVVLTVGASEMGQGSLSGLAQVLCEDLMVDPVRVTLAQGAPSLAQPAPVGAAIVTAGSSVTRNNFWRLRDAGAAAREMLVAAAMARIGDGNRAAYSVTDGVIRHAPSGQQLTYGQVAAAAALLPVPTGAALVPDGQFKSIGRTIARPDIPAKVDGSAIYGLDVRLPGMLYAVIRHAPGFGATLAATPGVPAGMVAVVPVKVVPGTGRGAELAGNVNAVAVVGSNTWDAMRAARRMSVSWKAAPNAAAMSSSAIDAESQRLMDAGTPYVAGGANPPGTLYTVESEGNAPGAIAASTRRFEATYALPYVAHACMEVLNCTVDYVPGLRCHIWAPTQVARSALTLAMSLTGLSADQVKVHVTFLGGGLGRKAELDFIAQAVQVGMALGKPVKLMWPREEDFSHDQYRPAARVRVRAALDSRNAVAGWSYRNVSPSILGQRGAGFGPTGDSQAWEASAALPYQFGARLTEWVSHTAQIPVGFWRSVGASINTFAVESMVDELAAAAGTDPYQFRRARLTNPRWLAVLDAVASASGWGQAAPAGTAKGIAIGAAFNSIVAQVVEVAKTSAGPRITRVWVAIDNYLTVNPGSVEAQITGGVVHAINATLYGRQTFVDGVAQSRNFSTSRMIRLQEMPAVSVTIVPAPAALDRGAAIGGVGELGVPTFAPAMANAWARASGIRVRTLPFFPNATMGGL